MVNLDRMTGGMLYLSITHLQREDTLQVFGCVGHIRPALWPRGCYCKHDWPQVDVLGCQIYRLLAHPCRCSRSDTFTPPGDTPHPTSYTQDWHLLPDGLAAGSSCGVTPVQFSGTTVPPTEGKVHTRERWPLVPLSQDGFFEGGDTFFQKCLLAYLKGPVLLCLYDTAGGPKSK